MEEFTISAVLPERDGRYMVCGDPGKGRGERGSCIKVAREKVQTLNELASLSCRRVL